MTQFRPMLASDYDPKYPLQFPVLVSPKIDGIRCVIRNGAPLTRSLKPVPNRHIRAALSGLPNFDGEIIVGDPTNPHVWNTTTSAVMSHAGEPDFTYYVFDMSAGNTAPFEARTRIAKSRAPSYAPQVRYLHHHRIDTMEQLMVAEQTYVQAGYEGLMIRSLDGPYKFGLSTAKEGHLLKMKRFDDMEAKVVDVKERMRNTAESKINERGLMEKDHKREHMTPAGDLGALICRFVGPDGYTIEFDVGSGFSDAQRAELWGAPPVGKFVKVKHQGFTPDGEPRFPVFLGFRDEKDIGP